MSRPGARAVAVLAAVAVVGVTAAAAQAGGDDHSHGSSIVRTGLTGYEEVPAISSDGSGRFRAWIDDEAQEIHYRLTYSDFPSPVLQSHIHFAQRSVNGAITVFLCTNLGNGPAGTPTCPADGGEVTGTITPDDMVAPAAAQGLAPGEFEELVAAIRAGVTYVNVHTQAFPTGEVRGQLDRRWW